VLSALGSVGEAAIDGAAAVVEVVGAAKVERNLSKNNERERSEKERSSTLGPPRNSIATTPAKE